LTGTATIALPQQDLRTEPTGIGDSQHLRALERANRVRLARAALKRRVAGGLEEAAEVILHSPWEAESMAVAELLMSQRRWGSTRCRKFLSAMAISENKTIGSMTERQRRALAARLGFDVGPLDAVAAHSG